ncbi:MAG: acyloxyacyl hydrolase [Chlorobiaceae bacterium]|nr:acyloxyacyl hydrolase [Chlorobiaceae bacterium]
MKYLMKAFVYPLFLFCSMAVVSAPARAEEAGRQTLSEKAASFSSNEIGVGSGYIWGALKQKTGNLTVYPAFIHLGFNCNSLFGIKSHNKSMHLVLEPFYNVIDNPVNGYETGCSIGLRFRHELSGPVDYYIEGSVGPMYLSVDTFEQGGKGFNFLDQIGVGIQCQLSENHAFYTGYRFRHISHAGLVDRPNIGINSNAIVAGFTWFY